ncbi:MAG: hypothetical protein IPQ08_05835 [Chitinophagaceae bacterium]|nr:hypothetical protein [Chitinophagaceae bacterium]
MRKLIALLLISSQAFAGLPPTTIQGQSDSSAKTKFGFQVPHNQSTDLGGIKALIETGNTNILKNPGFEGGSTGWTLSGTGSFTVDATAKGTGALGLNSSISTGGTTIKSDLVTIPNGYLGKNGVVSCDIKQASGTASRYLYVSDGTNPISTPTLINVNTNNFTENKINFIFPSSGSIQLVYEVVSGSGNQYIDDCKISLADNIGSVSQAILLGGVKITGCNNDFSAPLTSSTLTSMVTSPPTGCVFTPFGSATAPTGTARPAVGFPSMGIGSYKIEYEGTVSVRAQTTPGGDSGYFQFTDGTTTARELSTFNYRGDSSGATNPKWSGFSQSFEYTTPKSTVTWEIFAKSDGNSGSQEYISGTTAKPGVIRVYYFPSSSQQAVSSAQADYDWTAYTPTFTGFGTVTNIECQHQRVTSNLNIRCKYIIGTGTGVEARVSLPNSLTSADTTKIPTLQNVGSNGFSSSGQNGNMLIEPSVTYLTYALTGTNALSKALGTSFTTGLTHSFYASIPIQGWSSNQRAPTLVGSVTSNSGSAIRVDSALIGNNGTCSITSQSSSPGMFTSINPTPANGGCTITFTSGAFSSAPYFCSCNPTNMTASDQQVCRITTQSVSTFTYRVATASASYQNDPVQIMCFGPR